MAEKIEIEIEVDPVLGSSGKRKLTGEATRTGKKAGDNFERGFKRGASSLSSSLGSIRNQLLGLGAVFGAAFAFRGAVNAVKSIEQIETQLTVLLKSSKLAEETLRSLQDFAANTPFQLEGIAQAANQLLAFGISLDDIQPKLKTLGDIAAGSNSDLKEVALIFGQVSAAGKLTGERLLQLQERAIPIGAALASTLGVAESEVKDLVSAGKVGFKEFEVAFDSLSQAGGLFEGALQKQSQTVGGVLSTLSDNFFNLQVAIGKAFGPAIIDSGKAFIGILQELTSLVTSNGPQLVSTFKSLADFFIITPSKFWISFFGGGAARGVEDVNSEINNTEKELSKVEERLKAVQGTTLGESFLGSADQLRESVGDLTFKLSELKRERDKLVESQKSSTAGLREELALNEQKKQQAALEIQQLKEKQALQKQIGDIGLTDRQIAEEKLNQDLELLRVGEEQKALTEEEFRMRSLERKLAFDEQIRSIDEQSQADKLAALKQQEEAALASEATIGDKLANVGKQFKSVAKSFRVTSKDISKSLVTGIGNGAANAFAAFGAAAANGENAFKAFADAFLASLGQMFIQAGAGFILEGLAFSFAGLPNGPALVGAGAALAAFGGILTAVGGGGAPSPVTSGSGAIGSGGGLGTGDLETGSTITAQQEQEEIGASISVTVQGDVLDSDETGIRLVEILNNAFDTEGSTINQAVIA